MSYIEDTLEIGEQIVYKASTSKLALIMAIGMSLITMSPFGILRLFSTSVALTNKRVIGKTGILLTKSIVLQHANIQSITVRHGLFGKFLDYGNVTITGKNGNKVVFKAIAVPLMLQHEVDGAVEMAVLGRRLSDYDAIKF